MTILFDIDINNETFGCISTAIGDLCVFNITSGNQSDFYKYLYQEDKHKCGAEEYIRVLSIYICYPKDSLIDGKYMPNSIILKKDDVNKLEIDDLENISKLYLENNKYLYAEEKEKRLKNEKDDTIIISVDYGQTIHHKFEDESWTKYLYRLFGLDSIKQKKQHERLIKSVIGDTNFSNPLMKNINSTLSLGDTFSKTLDEFHNRIDFIPNPTIDLFEAIKKQKEHQRQPFNELRDRLDNLINISVESSKFIIESNKTQIVIANEIKESSDSSSFFSKINITMTKAVLILTFIGLVLTGYSVYYQASLKSHNEYNTLSKSMNGLADKMEKLTTSSLISNQNQFSKIFEVQKNEKEKYISLLHEQSLKLDKLAKQNKEQSIQIKLLENQVKKIQKGKSK